MVKRFEIYWVNLDPSEGSEIKKTRPCVIISPNELNKVLRTVIIAPLTSTIRNYPSRVNLKFKGKNGQIVLDQIRAVDKRRLIDKAGSIDAASAKKLLEVLLEIFS
jgi:mRNA interferase MazF